MTDEDRAARLHRQAPVAMAHCDVPVDISRRRFAGEQGAMQRIHLPRYRAGGVKWALLAVGGDQTRPYGPPEPNFPIHILSALRGIDDLYQEQAESGGEFAIVTSAAALDRALAAGQFAVFLHLEGGRPLAGHPSTLRNFYRLGLRSLQLVWYGKNELADSTSVPTPGGLSDLGMQVVEEMNRLGMIIDVTHLAEPGFWDVMRCSRGPVIASHANARALVDHPRNLSDGQIRALAERGGVVGVTFLPMLVGPNPDMADVVHHVNHIRRLVGIDHIAVGPDFIDYAADLILEDARARGIAVTDLTFPRGLADVTELANLTQGLVASGYSDSEVEKVLGGNLLRVCREVLR